MKLFRKGLAIMLACVMLVMAVPFGGLAVYADTAVLIEGEDAYNLISAGAGERGSATFTPKTTGYYTYYSAADKDVVGCIWRTHDEYGLGEDDDSGEGSNFSLRVFLQEGVSYTFEAWYWNSDNSGDIPVYLVPADVAVADLPVLNVGGSAEAVLDGENEYAYFAFTPETDGFYAFYSVCDKDTYGIIENAWGEQLNSDDDNGDNWNFRVVQYMNAGETYRLGARLLSNGTGSFTVYLAEYFPHVVTDVEFHDQTVAYYELEANGDYPMPHMTVYYADGTSEECTGRYFYDDEYGYDVRVICDIEYSDWRAGETYEVVAEVVGGEIPIRGSYTVTVEESPILKVEVDAPQHIVNFGGWSTYDSIYNEELGKYERTPEYRYYPPEPDGITIYMKDGSVWENGYVNWNGRDYWVNYNVPVQNYENQWGLGAHTVQGTIMGYEFTYDVEIVESPIASIEYQPLTLVEETNGYWTTDSYWDYDLQEYVERYYFRYDLNTTATVTMKDGTVYEDVHWFTWGDFNLSVQGNISQVKQPLQLGMNYLTGMVMGYEIAIPVEVIDTPIASIEFNPLSVMEYSNGYWDKGTYWDEETQQDVPYEYFYYYVYPNATVTMLDGTVYEDVSGLEWNGRWYSLREFTQNWENPLQVGMNYVTGSFLGYEYTLEIEVTESPIVSVVVPERELIENSNGEWRTDYYYDEMGNYMEGEYFEYWNYGPRNAIITLKDGTVHEGVSGFYWEDQWYGLSYYGQSYENAILPGRNERRFSILGYEGTYVLNVVESPVASVEIQPVICMQHTNGNWREGWNWDDELQEDVYYNYFHYDNIHPTSGGVTITLKDGTVINNNWFEWHGTEYSVNVDSQWYDRALELGVNEWHGEIAGYNFTYTIEVVDTPVVSVEMDAPVALMENRNGYWTTDMYWDEDLQQDVEVEYFYYYRDQMIPSLTVTLKDGSVYKLNANNTSILWNGQWYYLSVQSQANGDYLRPGRNIRTGSILGYDFEYAIDINALNSNADFEYMEAEDHVIITDCYLQDETVEIPATINGKPVIGVAGLSGAMFTLRHLILPDSVVTIGDYVLNNINNLESVHFGAGVSNLTAEMFGYCWNLQSITISEDNPYYCVVNRALHNKGLDTFIAYPTANENKEYVVPATVVNIEVLDWYGIYDQLLVIFPEDHIAFVTVDGVTYNKEMTVVISCRKDKTGDYVMPETVEEITSGAFMNTGLTSVVVSPKVTEIVYCAFASCASLESVILPEGLVSIEQSAFEQTASLREIDLPDTLEHIGNYSFYKSGLTALSVPDSVMSIDHCAFDRTQIQTLDLGKGLQYLGSSAFANTPVVSVVLPDSLTEMGSSAFENCGALSSVTIGSGLESISSEAFSRTPSLMDITIPGNIDWIQGSAFAESGLVSVTLEDGVGFISGGAFYDCNNLLAVHFPATVYGISSTAFNSCDSLRTLTVAEDNKTYFANGNCVITHDGTLQVGCGGSVIPNDGSVLRIEEYAFYDCDGLQSITFPDSLTHIGRQAFYDCDSIPSVVIPDSVTGIDYAAFCDCDSLMEAVLGDGIQYMEGSVFRGCPLQSVDLGNGLPYIPGHSFYDTELSTVFIPSSVTDIMYWSFYSCDNLTSIELPISVTSIGNGAFGDCYNLTDVYYQGTEADRENIDIGWGNECLLNATWHYGWVNENWAEIPTCDHEYDSVCDSDCNLCGARRKAPHAYEYACSEWCSLCKEWREVDHVYDNACDADCNECGAMRAVTAHWYDNACDAYCNECGAVREVASHRYDNACDSSCNECGAIRATAGHVYDDRYDADCNECGEYRETLSPITLVVDSVNARPGDTFEVAVRVENNTGLVGLRLDVVYDTDLLELVGAVGGKDFATATFGPVQSPFNVMWVDAIHPNNTADGAIAILTFRVKEEAPLGASVIEVIPYEDDFIDDQMEAVRCETVSGTVNVIETTPGDADGDGAVGVKDLAYLMRYLTGWEVDVDIDALDVNNDGKLNNRDFALIQRYLNGWDVTLQ